jgi:hypothetical protein
MSNYLLVIVLVVTLSAATLKAEVPSPRQLPYPLPAEVRESLTKVASESDILIFGETHGTQELPAIVETILDTLNKLGYRVIALEVPHNEQSPIQQWATGETDVVPAFFAKPGQDGRGNMQVLQMVRRALMPPYNWELICFDESDEDFMHQLAAKLPKGSEGRIGEAAAKMPKEDITALGLQRDATMAELFSTERKKFAKIDKLLGVCGNLHARTANHAPANSELSALWPSFAAVLKRDHPNWHIHSINVQAFGGEYFNGGKVNKVGERPLAHIEARPCEASDWDWELNLPHATAATFYKTPE